MPLLKHAIKKVRQDKKHTARNAVYRKLLKKDFKAVIKACETGKKENLTELMKKAFSTIDKAWKKNLMKKNTAARRKSRIARLVNAVTTGVKPTAAAPVVNA
jgi:small subunit ribosomal protein S20